MERARFRRRGSRVSYSRRPAGRPSSAALRREVLRMGERQSSDRAGRDSAGKTQPRAIFACRRPEAPRPGRGRGSAAHPLHLPGRRQPGLDAGRDLPLGPQRRDRSWPAGALAEVVESDVPNLASRRPRLRRHRLAGLCRRAARAGSRRLPRAEPLSHLLSVYGVAGLTAYFGLLKCGRPARGRDGGGLRRGRVGGIARRPDRQDQGLPDGRDRRRRAPNAPC